MRRCVLVIALAGVSGIRVQHKESLYHGGSWGCDL